MGRKRERMKSHGFDRPLRGGSDRLGQERMLRIVREVYHLHGHDSETFNLMADLESALEGRAHAGNLVQRYGELMKRLDEK